MINMNYELNQRYGFLNTFFYFLVFSPDQAQVLITER